LRFWLRLWALDAISFLASPLRMGAAVKARILVYHDVGDVLPALDPFRLSVPPALFERQIRHLRQAGFQFLSLDDTARGLAEGSVPPRSVAITFDDGYVSFLTDVLPILRRYGVPATLFVAAAYVGAARFPFNSSGPFSRPLTWPELQQVASAPGIQIGSHTMTHRHLHLLTPHDRRDELIQARATLEARLGQPVRTFAYPYGAWGTFPADVQADVAAAGYTIACANVKGTNAYGANPLALHRVRIGWEDDLWRFRLKIIGAYDWSDQVRRPLTRASESPHVKTPA
jgi:peptidoglycan/xylan/chitin deacetylase (PgdA/CDA1 family)